MNALTILFVGLITYLTDGNARIAVAIDASNGMNLQGHHVQDHAAKLLVREEYVDGTPSWPGEKKDGVWRFDLDGRSLTLAGIDKQRPLIIDKTFCNVPRIAEECPMLREEGAHKDNATIESEAAASLRLESGSLSAFCNIGGAVATEYQVGTTGNVEVTAKKKNMVTWTVTVKPGATIEIRNEPVVPEEVGNHFIAYYVRIAAPGVTVGCTNLPFKRQSMKATCGVCPIREDRTIVSTVACSNSTFP